MSLKFLIKSVDRRFLAGILALIFMLIMTLSDVASSQENQAGKEEVLRKASLRWMQVGMQQYESNLFTEAELSFRRARVFKNYLTATEREQLDEYLANSRIAISEGKQALANTQPADESVEQDQPVKPEVNVEKVKDNQPSIEEQQQTAEELDKTSSQPSRQKLQSVVVAEPSVSKIQLAAESSSGAVVVKDESFSSKLMQLSSWLTENRRNILMISLPVLAVLVFISKLQGRRKIPGRRVYTNHVPGGLSFIGSKLNGSNGNNRAVKDSKNARSASAAAGNPKRKSFTQSTEHWKEKHAGHTPAAGKPFRTNEKWPQRKDKFEDDGPVIAKDEQKQCSKCEELKAHSDFHKDKSCKDGLARWCKDCKAAAARKNRKKRAAERK